jgi:3-deoxy-D-manno-octulosonic-acid transferase
MRGLYTLLWLVALHFLPLRLWWRGRREPGYREHIGERYGRYGTESPASGLLPTAPDDDGGLGQTNACAT